MGATHLLYHYQGRGRPIGGVKSYTEKVLGIENANLIGYWPMNESSGAVAINAQGVTARNGAYTGVTLGQTGIGDGNTCPLFDGANDYNHIYTTSLRDAFSATAGTVAIWIKASGVGIWTDSTARGLIRLHATNQNQIYLFRTAVNNRITIRYEANNVDDSVDVDGITTTDWIPIAMTWNKTADQVIAYYNGSQTGATQTGLGVWAGSLASASTCIGALSTAPDGVWSGYLAHAAVWTKTLTAAQILALATV